MENKKVILCFRCQVELAEQKTRFTYLGREFDALMMKCPQCGQLYISEETAKGRMFETEKLLEGK